MTKKALALLSLCALMVVSTGCSSNPEAEPANTAAQSAPAAAPADPSAGAATGQPAPAIQGSTPVKPVGTPP